MLDLPSPRWSTSAVLGLLAVISIACGPAPNPTASGVEPTGQPSIPTAIRLRFDMAFTECQAVGGCGSTGRLSGPGGTALEGEFGHELSTGRTILANREWVDLIPGDYRLATEGHLVSDVIPVGATPETFPDSSCEASFTIRLDGSPQLAVVRFSPGSCTVRVGPDPSPGPVE